MRKKVDRCEFWFNISGFREQNLMLIKGIKHREPIKVEREKNKIK